MSPRHWAFFLLLIASNPLCAAGSATTLEIAPFRTFNQSPLIQIYGLPAPEDSTILAPRASRVEVSLDISSNFTDGTGPNEMLILDGETYRTTFRYRRGIGAGWEAGVDVPYVTHDGGFLDDFIVNWHSTFGLPQGGRDHAPKDRLDYRYVRNGTALIDVHEHRSGVGDVRLIAGYQWRRPEENAGTPLALHMSLKLPTGEANDLLGSGGTDLAAWVSTQVPVRSALYDWGWFGGGGLLMVSDGDVLPAQQRNLVAFGTLGIGWRPAAWILLQLQLDGTTSFYDDTHLRQLDATTVQLVMGGALRLGAKMRLDIGVSEDVAVETAPDVSFHLNFRSRL